jgi:hypothetical protein
MMLKSELDYQNLNFNIFLLKLEKQNLKVKDKVPKKQQQIKAKAGWLTGIYGCGIFDDGKIIVPLESTLVFPNN